MTGQSDQIAARRKRYAAQIARAAHCADPAIETAFATVEREAFLPPPPWLTIEPLLGAVRETSNPEALYEDVLVAIDRALGINNGQPSLHAAWIAALAVRPGETIVHVGCGGGYYSAILALLAGAEGRVVAYEIEPGVAALATGALKGLANVEVHCASGSGGIPAADVIYVNAAAQAPQPDWLAALKPGGRLLFPWRIHAGADAAMLITRRNRGFAARSIGSVRFISLRDQSAVGGAPSASGDIRAIRSLTLTDERPPDRTAVAIFPHAWFSSAAAD